MSCIDHFFVTPELRSSIQESRAIDSGANTSDHRPVVLHIQLPKFTVNTTRNVNQVSFKVRWDKGNLADYYHLTGEALSNLKLECSGLTCSVECNSTTHKQAIDGYYNKIVMALKRAQQLSVPSIPHSALRHFRNDELDDLKEKSIFWHDVWVNAGRPGSGIIHQIKSSCKLKYKFAIRHAFYEHENQHNHEIFDHFLNKCIPEFWKSSSGKFKQNIAKDVFINGSNKDLDVANGFADHFKAFCSNSNYVTEAKSEFEALLTSVSCDNFDADKLRSLVSVESMDKCIKKLKLGKASGPDGLSAEHLVHAHPALVMHM